MTAALRITSTKEPNLIHVKNLSKTYTHDKHEVEALRNVSFSVEPGEIFGIIGKSGSGKSTLVRCLNLLEKPSHGEIILDGICLNTLTRDQLRQARRSISLIFQHFNLLESRTVFENIAFPLELSGELKKNIAQKANDLLALVHLEDRAHAYPRQLSGGQKQRVAIARALITEPKVLLCDEPTSALDPESTRAILDLLKQINQQLKITMIIITHEMTVVKKICDRMLVLDHGKVAEYGKVLDVFTQPKSAIAKSLTQEELHLTIPEEITQRLQNTFSPGLILVVRLAFVGKQADEPVIYALYERFKVIVNILQAALETIHDAPVGFMLCQLIGEPADVAEAVAYLKELHVRVEVLGYE